MLTNFRPLFDNAQDNINNIDAVSVSDSSCCDLDNCTPTDFIPECSLKVLNQNIRSISKNFDGLYTILSRTKVDWDVIILTECWLRTDLNIPDLTGYNHFQTINNLTQNEGVVVYVREDLNVTVEEPSFPGANGLLIKFDRNIIILALYRPPGYRDIPSFLNNLGDILLLIEKYENIIIAGDVNINIHPDHRDSDKLSYLTLLAAYGLLPAHTIPTRQKACIDHVMLKTVLPASVLVANSSLTDHETVILYLTTKTKRTVAKRTKTRTNYEKLDRDLNQIDFTEIYNMQDANLAADTMVNLIRHAIKTNSKTVKVPNRKKVIKDWITPGLLRCIRHRDSLHKQHKKTPNNEILKLSFTRYRNYCNKQIKNAKIEYDKQEIHNAGKNSKQLWTAINNITNRGKKKEKNSHLLTLSSTPHTSVNDINNFFADIGRNLAEKIVNTEDDSTDKTTYKNIHSMTLLPTDEAEVETLIMSLRSDCAVGWDGISSNLLKKYRAIFVPPLTHVCNLALTTGKFPKTFKKAIIHPIHKSGDRDRVNNYRPIAVLPALSKILERIMNSRLVNFLEKQNILSPTQYGFRAGRSTSDAVHELTSYVVENLDRRKKVIGIFVDLAKAFDTVSVPILMHKMENVGVRGQQLALFEDYLSERTQSVKVDDFISEDRTVTYGTPQGSVLGPPLFLIYINDLGNLNLQNGKIITFADDTVLLFSDDTWDKVFMCAQSGFNTVTKWLRSSILTLNADKSKYITFSLKANAESHVSRYKIVAHSCPNPNDNLCNCTNLNRTGKVTYLGVIVDSYMRFQDHIDNLNSRLRKLMYVFKTLRRVADDKLKKTVYLALAQSLLTYCITSWGGAPKSNLIDLERAQRAILKISRNLPYRYPTHQLYRDTEVLTVRQLFLLATILKQHSLLEYHPSLTVGRRRVNPVDRLQHSQRTKFSRRFFSHLGSFLYNKINGTLGIFHLTKKHCKMKVTNWLQQLNYTETEEIFYIPE